MESCECLDPKLLVQGLLESGFDRLQEIGGDDVVLVQFHAVDKQSTIVDEQWIKSEEKKRPKTKKVAFLAFDAKETKYTAHQIPTSYT